MDFSQHPSSYSHTLLAIGSKRRTLLSSIRTTATTSTSTSSTATSSFWMDDGVVCLCDVQSGFVSHELVGHNSGGVHAVKWSLDREFELESGGNDGRINLWDVRRSGS